MRDPLETELGVTPPAGVRELPGERREELAAAVGDAKRRQIEALRLAGEQALGLIPRVLRGPIRRLF